MRITKNKKFDKRYKQTEIINMWINKYTRAAAVAGFIIGALIGCALFAQKTSPNDPKQSINPVTVVSATTDKYTERGYARCFSPIICLRDIGEELGVDNKDILIAIRIAKAESGLRPDAIGKNSNGTYDIGLMQINDVHNKRISRQDRLNVEKNITFAYQLRKEQGNWNAWSVCRSKVDCR